MAENATTTAARPGALSARQRPAVPQALPGTRAALMRAAVDALRAAAADLDDPRLSPLRGAPSRHAAAVQAWLVRRAELLTPPSLTAYQRNQLQLLDLDQPDLSDDVRQATVEAFSAVAGALAPYGVDARQLRHLRADLVEALAALAGAA